MTKKKIFLIVLITVLVCLVSLGIYFLLKVLDITNIKSLRNFIGKFGGWGYVVFVILQVLISLPIFVVPFEDEFWVALGIILFGVKWACILSIISMLIISTLLYLMGKCCGEKFLKKLVGEKALMEMQENYAISNKISLPILYMIPLFPHDVLCITSGITKINFPYFFVVTAIMRSLEVVSLCFLGGSLIAWKNLTRFDWIVLANLVIVDIYLLGKLKKYLESKVKK